MQWYSSVPGRNVRQTYNLPKNPSKPLNSGSKRPPSKCFLTGHHFQEFPSTSCHARFFQNPPFPNRFHAFAYRYCRRTKIVSTAFLFIAFCPLSYFFFVSFLYPSKTDLVETNVLGLLTEALTAEVEVVLADQTGLVLADAAKKIPMLVIPHVLPRIFDIFLVSMEYFSIVPAARALAVGSRARVPNAFVRHDCGCWGGTESWVADGDFARVEVGVKFCVNFSNVPANRLEG